LSSFGGKRGSWRSEKPKRLRETMSGEADDSRRAVKISPRRQTVLEEVGVRSRVPDPTVPRRRKSQLSKPGWLKTHTTRKKGTVFPARHCCQSAATSRGGSVDGCQGAEVPGGEASKVARATLGLPHPVKHGRCQGSIMEQYGWKWVGLLRREGAQKKPSGRCYVREDVELL